MCIRDRSCISAGLGCFYICCSMISRLTCICRGGRSLSRRLLLEISHYLLSDLWLLSRLAVVYIACTNRNQLICVSLPSSLALQGRSDKLLFVVLRYISLQPSSYSRGEKSWQVRLDAPGRTNGVYNTGFRGKAAHWAFFVMVRGAESMQVALTGLLCMFGQCHLREY